MIYDCFMFSNELDILEIRLNELKDIVDKFVIVESDMTTAGLSKKLYFEENKERFKEFQDKIIHRTYRCPPEIKDPWARESYSRDFIKQVIKKANDDDIIIISDVDEIPSLEVFKSFYLQMEGRTLVQKFFYYRLNCFIPSYIWGWSKIVSGKIYNQMSPQQIRYARMPNLEVPGGWHFSFLGTPEVIANKIKSFAHQEYNKPEIINIQYIKQCIDAPRDIFNRPEYTLQYIKIDNTFPRFIQNNKDKYIRQGLIKDMKNNIDGMMQDGELDILRNFAREHNKILEIGSWHGLSTRALAENTPGVVYAVDTWNGALDNTQKLYYKSAKDNLGDHAFMEFCKNNGDLIDKGKIIPIRMNSTNANWVFHKLGLKFDMVFIDGDHSYSAVKNDIKGVKNILEKGALLCGHDYLSWCGVKRAVDELIPKFNIKYSMWLTNV